MSPGERELEFQLKAMKIPFEKEYRFHPPRRWKFDFAIKWGRENIAIEIEGMGGRHQSMKGFRLDLDKYDQAFRDGWVVYRCSAQMVKSGRALDSIMVRLELR